MMDEIVVARLKMKTENKPAFLLLQASPCKAEDRMCSSIIESERLLPLFNSVRKPPTQTRRLASFIDVTGIVRTEPSHIACSDTSAVANLCGVNGFTPLKWSLDRTQPPVRKEPWHTGPFIQGTYIMELPAFLRHLLDLVPRRGSEGE